MFRPIIEDARFIAAVAGECYAVMRVTCGVAIACEAAQARLREALGGLDLVYPAPHLTLRSFERGTALRRVRFAVRSFALRTRPVKVSVDGLGVFPAPHRVVYASVWRSRSVIEAYRALRREAAQRKLPETPGEERSIAAWRPHLSLLYGQRLAERDWQAVLEVAGALELQRAESVVNEVEIVTYDLRGEHTVGRYGLLGGAVAA